MVLIQAVVKTAGEGGEGVKGNLGKVQKVRFTIILFESSLHPFREKRKKCRAELLLVADGGVALALGLGLRKGAHGTRLNDAINLNVGLPDGGRRVALKVIQFIHVDAVALS